MLAERQPVSGACSTAIVLVAALIGCVEQPAAEQDETPPGPTAIEVSFLRSYAHDLVEPTYARMVTDAAALREAVHAWAAAPEDSGVRSAARIAWHAAMDTWQRAELLQIGPAARDFADGDMRFEIYSWPIVTPCRIDMEAVADIDASIAERGVLVNTYGLDALGYLLHHVEPTTACPARVPLVETGAWSALDPGEIQARRARYAALVATQLELDVQRLWSRWQSYAPDLVAAGVRPPYAQAIDAHNEVFAALLYLKYVALDQKIAHVAGLTGRCDDGPCPEYAESRWSGRDTQNLRLNLEATRAVLFGADAPGAVGFAALLEARGATELSAALAVAVDTAIERVAAVDTSLGRLAVADPDRMQAIYEAVRAVTILLQTQFVTALGLSLPIRTIGDDA